MKTLLVLIVLTFATLTGCTTATNYDKLQTDLAAHINKCDCLVVEGNVVSSRQIDWTDKNKLKTQVQNCRCEVQFDMDEVENPLTYIKPGCRFYTPSQGFPWDPGMKRIIQIE